MKSFINFQSCLLIFCVINYNGFVSSLKNEKSASKATTPIINSERSVSDDPCQNGTTHRVEVKFTTQVVQNEYIVSFDGYLKSNVRKNILRSALNNSNVQNWRVIPRSNPASDFPSDFDVIHVEEIEPYSGKEMNIY